MRFDADISAYLVAFTVAMCFIGLLTKSYKENWLQFCGLVGLILGGTAQAWHLFQLPDDRTVSWRGVTIYAGLALFALGTAIKIWKHRKTDHNPNGVTHGR